MQEAFLALIKGALPNVTVAWGRRKQGSGLPAVVLYAVSETVDYTYAGSVRLITTRVQADILAATYVAALAVDRSLVPALDGYSGTIGGTEFAGIFLESRFDDTAEPGAGSEPIARISRDLMVKHKEI